MKTPAATIHRRGAGVGTYRSTQHLSPRERLIRHFTTRPSRWLTALAALGLWNVSLWLWPGLISAVMGLPLVLLMPGLFLAIILGARRLTATVMVFSVGLSLLLLMALGLAANFLPLAAHAARPLDTATPYVLFNASYIALTLAAGSRLPSWQTALHRHFKRAQRLDWLVAAGAGLVPILAVMGAISLNNGGGPGFAVAALVMAAVMVPVVFIQEARLARWTIIWTIAAVTLSLLLATSLRGWYISGQDMQHEFQVFNLARLLGRWDISVYNDPYNACLSITLLPVMLSKLLGLSGVVVFKLINQLIFVTVPVSIFLTTRQFLGTRRAYLTALLFIGLPSFSIDVPFITRQEIAYVFVTLAIASVFAGHEAWLKRHRNLLLVATSAGVVVSHYSTAYLFIGALVLTYGGSRLIRLIRLWRRRPTINLPGADLSTWAVIIICLCVNLWLVQITKVSSDLAHKLGQAGSSISQVVHDPLAITKSLDAPGAGSSQAVINRYVAGTSAEPASRDAANAATVHLLNSNRPPTAFTRWLKSHTGLDATKLTAGLYYGLATKLYLLLIAIGTGQLLRPSVRRRLGHIPPLYLVWTVSAGAMLAAQILVPAIASDYGITRAFMQAFIVLGLPATLGLSTIADWWKPTRNWVLIGVVTSLLVLYSGLLPYLTGGLHEQLSLANRGQYYGSVYPQDTDLAAYTWIENQLPAGSKINIADFAAYYAAYPQSANDTTSSNLLPFQLLSGNYALLSSSQTRDHVVYTFGDLIPLSIDPSQYNGDDLLYSNGSNQLYQRGRP